MRERVVALGLAALCLVATDARAEGTAIGLILGEPTGVSLRTGLTGGADLTAALAWSLADDVELQAQGDFVLWEPGFIDIGGEVIADLYYGLGARVRFAEEGSSTAGARVPLGARYAFAERPVELFLEIVPVVDLVPDTELDFNGGIGVRYRF